MARDRDRGARDRGSALVLALVVAIVVAVLALAFADGSARQARGAGHLVSRLQALHAAQGGISAVANHLTLAATDPAPRVGDEVALAGDVLRPSVHPAVDLAGRAQAPGNGAFRARAVRVGPSTFHVVSRGGGGDLVRTVEAWLERSSEGARPFARAAFGDADVELHSGAFTDSYDSTAGMRWFGPSGAWSSYFDPVAHPPFLVRDPNGALLSDPIRGGPLALRSTTGSPADARGDVASNGDIALRSSAQVFGDARPGAGRSVTMDTSDHVEGLTSPLGEPLAFAPLAPAAPERGDNDAVTGLPPHGAPARVSRFTVYDFTGAGPEVRVVLEALTVESGGRVVLRGRRGQTIELHLVGPDGLVVESGSRLDVEPPGQDRGPRVRVFTGGSLIVRSGACLNRRGDPVQLQLHSSGGAEKPCSLEVRLESSCVVQAAVYAPLLPIEVGSTTEVFGALVGARLALRSSALLHYDEALAGLTLGSGPGPWSARAIREVP